MRTTRGPVDGTVKVPLQPEATLFPRALVQIFAEQGETVTQRQARQMLEAIRDRSNSIERIWISARDMMGEFAYVDYSQDLGQRVRQSVWQFQQQRDFEASQIQFYHDLTTTVQQQQALEQFEETLTPRQHKELDRVIQTRLQEYLHSTEGRIHTNLEILTAGIRAQHLIATYPEAQAIAYLGQELPMQPRVLSEQRSRLDQLFQGCDPRKRLRPESRQAIMQAADQRFLKISGRQVDRQNSLWFVLRDAEILAWYPDIKRIIATSSPVEQVSRQEVEFNQTLTSLEVNSKTIKTVEVQPENLHDTVTPQLLSSQEFISRIEKKVLDNLQQDIDTHFTFNTLYRVHPPRSGEDLEVILRRTHQIAIEGYPPLLFQEENGRLIITQSRVSSSFQRLNSQKEFLEAQSREWQKICSHGIVYTNYRHYLIPMGTTSLLLDELVRRDQNFYTIHIFMRDNMVPIPASEAAWDVAKADPAQIPLLQYGQHPKWDEHVLASLRQKEIPLIEAYGDLTKVPQSVLEQTILEVKQDLLTNLREIGEQLRQEQYEQLPEWIASDHQLPESYVSLTKRNRLLKQLQSNSLPNVDPSLVETTAAVQRTTASTSIAISADRKPSQPPFDQLATNNNVKLMFQAVNARPLDNLFAMEATRISTVSELLQMSPSDLIKQLDSFHQQQLTVPPLEKTLGTAEQLAKQKQQLVRDLAECSRTLQNHEKYLSQLRQANRVPVLGKWAGASASNIGDAVGDLDQMQRDRTQLLNQFYAVEQQWKIAHQQEKTYRNWEATPTAQRYQKFANVMNDPAVQQQLAQVQQRLAEFAQWLDATKALKMPWDQYEWVQSILKDYWDGQPITAEIWEVMQHDISAAQQMSIPQTIDQP
jgi:hypothetical protein